MASTHIHHFRLPSPDDLPAGTDIIVVKCKSCPLEKEHKIYWEGYSRSDFNYPIRSLEDQRRKVVKKRPLNKEFRSNPRYF